jgi:hypothetical protein
VKRRAALAVLGRVARSTVLRWTLAVLAAILVAIGLHDLGVFLGAPITPTISRLEIAWFIGGSAALRFNVSGWLLRRRIRDRAIEQHAAPRNVMLARARLEGELTALLVQVFFWLFGILALIAPEPAPRSESASDTLFALLAPPGFLAVQWILALGSYRQRRYDNLIGRMPIAAPSSVQG